MRRLTTIRRSGNNECQSAGIIAAKAVLTELKARSSEAMASGANSAPVMTLDAQLSSALKDT